MGRPPPPGCAVPTSAGWYSGTLTVPLGMNDRLTLGTILAHPDDETFGVGGTLIRYADEGVRVHSLCLTQGEQGWNGDPQKPVVSREELGAKRAAELAEAGRRMGVTTTTCLTYPDGDLA